VPSGGEAGGRVRPRAGRIGRGGSGDGAAVDREVHDRAGIAVRSGPDWWGRATAHELLGHHGAFVSKVKDSEAVPVVPAVLVSLATMVWRHRPGRSA